MDVTQRAGSIRNHRGSSPLILLVVGALAVGGCSASVPEGRTFDLNTEIADFYLFHPDDLQHRRTSPPDWTLYEFAIAPEFAAGNMVAFSTGADGGFRLRLTEGNLTAREQGRLACSWNFRYRVRHGRVLVDNGDQVPADKSSPFRDALDTVPHTTDPISEERWFPLPNGSYEVIVSAIDWERDQKRGAADRLPAYVVQFKKVDRLDAIKVAPCAPRLEPGPRAEPKFYPVAVDQAVDETSESLPQTCPVVVAPELILVPGFETAALTVSASEYARLQPHGDNLAEYPPVLALLDSEQTQRVGVLARLGSALLQENGSGQVTFHSLKLVNVA